MITGAAIVAGVVGAPISQSLSPVIHNAWIAAAGLDAAYVPFAVRPDGFEGWVEGLRSGGVRGVNVTMPFKGQALRTADWATQAAEASGGANLLLFDEDGKVGADSTDGAGLLAAFAEQAPAWRPEAGPVTVFGAGGAAGSALEALLCANVPEARIVVRDPAKARHLQDAFGDWLTVLLFSAEFETKAVMDATAVINATPLGFRGRAELDLPWSAVPSFTVIMDMVTAPLETRLLRSARAHGHVTVDGLAMLIGQARPSFEAFYGPPPPAEVDVRALCLAELERRG